MVSHITIGAAIRPVPMAAAVLTCLPGAVTAAKFAKKCEIVKLNRVIGAVLLAPGAVR